MVSKQAKKSINRYKNFAFLLSAVYQSAHKTKKWRLNLFRSIIDLQGVINPKVKDTKKEEIFLDGIRTLKITTPKSDPERILLYFHGGGFSFCSPESHYSLVSYLADITEMTVFVPDYRLGPENKFPAQLEDGLKSYLFLLNDMQYSSSQIAIGGDSAGGNLALTTLLKLKEKNYELPACLALLSPWVDPTSSGNSYTIEMANRDILLGPTFKQIWKNNDNAYDFFIDEKDMDESNPYIVPLKGDYKNCPPMLIQVGTEELLLSDSQTLKEVLDRDECIHEYYEWEGMYHVFHLDARMPETIEAFNQIGNFLKKYIKKSNAKL
jgi:monoterpene epsilon-lactone hydrolase|tara:strand:- start:82 stop:1050 length:969 start_codon:yes stop_codon:yes gene_type:complete